MISVIIPTHNRAAFLEEAVRSVLEQDYFAESTPDSWEFLIIDDGSEDGTNKLVAALSQSIRYYYQDHMGVSAARNLGLRLARGEHIAFLDSDDLWLKGKIRAQMDFMAAHPEAKVCCTEEVWIRHGLRHNPGKRHQKFSGRIFDKVLPLCLLSLSSALFRREVFDEVGVFDEGLPACEDYDLGIRLAHRYPIFFLPEKLIVKRGGHPDQLSHKYWGMDRFRVFSLEKAFELGLTSEEKGLVRAEIVKKSRVLLKGYVKRGNQAEVEKYTAILKKYE